eukprot:4850630-Pleurochrysis_carterae.AAC.2
MLFNGTSYAAAHIRVADAHWDLTDCKHSINSQPVASVSCGDGVNAINYSSIAQELWYMLKTTDQKLVRASVLRSSHRIGQTIAAFIVLRVVA